MFCCTQFSGYAFNISTEGKYNVAYYLPIDSGRIITELYRNTIKIAGISATSFSCRHSYNKRNKTVQIICGLNMEGNVLKYQIELKDTKGIYAKNYFSAGDDYQYLNSSFYINGCSLSLSNLHNSNNNDDLTPIIADIWSTAKEEPKIKYYRLPVGFIYLIKGDNPFCNGHNCADYIVYILYVINGKASVRSLYFSGTNGAFNFNNTFLFHKNVNKNPMIFVPRNNWPVKSNSDFDIYEIQFDKLQKTGRAPSL